MADAYKKIAQLKSIDAFRARLEELEIELPVDDRILTAAEDSPLAAPITVGGFSVGNRWCIHPMEGWDANRDGSPSAHTLRRWKNFGLSGAKLIWGGEAAAVQEDGRANPHQTLATPGNRDGLAALLDELLAAHREHVGSTDDLLVGLQLTHSGRFCRPNSKHLEPRIAYHHPLLDAKFGSGSRDYPPSPEDQGDRHNLFGDRISERNQGEWATRPTEINVGSRYAIAPMFGV